MAALPKKKQYMEAQDSSATQTKPMEAGTIHQAVDRVWEALNSDKYDWRTVNGIARDTGLPTAIVSNILEQNLADKVVRSVNKDNPGAYLYASRERYNRIRGPWNKFLSAVTSQIK